MTAYEIKGPFGPAVYQVIHVETGESLASSYMRDIAELICNSLNYFDSGGTLYKKLERNKPERQACPEKCELSCCLKQASSRPCSMPLSHRGPHACDYP